METPVCPRYKSTEVLACSTITANTPEPGEQLTAENFKVERFFRCHNGHEFKPKK